MDSSRGHSSKSARKTTHPNCFLGHRPKERPIYALVWVCAIFLNFQSMGLQDKAEALERRLLVEEQDAEYRESLAMDNARERLRIELDFFCGIWG